MEYPFSPEQITDFFYSETWKRILYFIKLFSGLISLALFAGIIVLGVKTQKFWERFSNIAKAVEGVREIKIKGKTIKRWEEITTKSKSHIESDWKISVVEADKFMDDLIKQIGFKGKDMGERLKQINPSQISNINEIWQAHKIRNNLVHDPNFKITFNDAEFVVKTYEKTLKELELI